MNDVYDIVIIGGGIYGLYSASYLAKNKLKVLVLEREKSVFSRASMVNQARVHNGLHYPRGEKTIMSILKYRNRFIKEFEFSINKQYDAYYGVSLKGSKTSVSQFRDIMALHDINGVEINPSTFFNSNKLESLIKTSEFSYDYKCISQYYKQKIKDLNIDIFYNVYIKDIVEDNEHYQILFNGNTVTCHGLINATYSSLNGINKLSGQKTLNIDYELCEISLCKVPIEINHTGLTIMDGDFFSIMPFGFSGLHSLSSVHFTPHYVSQTGSFPCMRGIDICSPESFQNCNYCKNRPNSAFDKMLNIYKNYMKPSLHDVIHMRSYYAIKPILRDSYLTDDRITMINVSKNQPIYLSVLSGKFFTFYELDPYLDNIISLLK